MREQAGTGTAQNEPKDRNARSRSQLEAATAHEEGADATANAKNAPHDDDERAAGPQPTESQAVDQSG